MNDERYDRAGRWCAMALTSAFLAAKNRVSREEFDCSTLTDIARSMVVQYGMSPDLGHVTYERDQRGMLGGMARAWWAQRH